MGKGLGIAAGKGGSIKTSSLHQTHGSEGSAGGRLLACGHGQRPSGPGPSDAPSSVGLLLPPHLPHATWPAHTHQAVDAVTYARF